MDILERLRYETRDLHKALENDLPVMRPDFQLSDYRRLLGRFYGFYMPLEMALVPVPDLDVILPDWPQRRKTDSLVKDLTALGSTRQEIAELPLCVHLPALPGVGEALGCLYVLEGSTLGGQIIGRHLESALQIGFDNGASFFRSYRDLVGPMWRAFQAVLRTRPPTEHEQMINAARQTFESIHRWLKEDADRIISPASGSIALGG